MFRQIKFMFDYKPQDKGKINMFMQMRDFQREEGENVLS